MDPWLSVSAAHNIGEVVRHQVRTYHPNVTESFIHIGLSTHCHLPQFEMFGCLIEAILLMSLNMYEDRSGES